MDPDRRARVVLLPRRRRQPHAATTATAVLEGCHVLIHPPTSQNSASLDHYLRFLRSCPVTQQTTPTPQRPALFKTIGLGSVTFGCGQ